MKLRILGIVLLLGVAGCQSQRSLSPYASRSLASTTAFRSFIENIATKSKKYSSTKVEQSILKYIKRQESGQKVGNWAKVGLSRDEVKMIKSLDDNHAFMPKVRKWVTENITRVLPGLERKIAADAYDIMMTGRRYLGNPYRTSQNVSSHVSSRRNVYKPGKMPNRQTQLLGRISKLPSKAQGNYKKTLSQLLTRGKANPSIKYNGMVIVESGSKVHTKTGLKGMGSGCDDFAKNAPDDILARKANVDLYRAEYVERQAYSKYGKSFQTFSEVPVAMRMTQKELDDATAHSFKKLLNYTDDEARIAVRRLKRKPCSLY